MGGSLALAAGCSSLSGSGSRVEESPSSASGPAFADALAHYSTGLALEWQDREAESFSNFFRAAELDPDNEELQFRVALNLVQQQRGPEAVAVMERLAKRHPKSERAQLWTALIYHATGQFEQALQAYDRVRKINPTSSVAYLQKAELLLRQKRMPEAIAVLESGLPKVEKPLDLYRALGPLEHAQARMEQAAGRTPQRLPHAIRTFEQALARYPDDASMREILGRLYIMAGRIDQALDTYAPLDRPGQNDLRLSQQLAVSFLLAPDRQAVITALADRTEREPGNARVLYYLGAVLEQSKLPGEAAEVYRRAITADPAWSAPYLRRVVLQIAAEEPEEAILTLEDGLLQQPDEARFLELLAYIHLGRQDYDGALDAFARAEHALDAQHKAPVSASFFLSHAFAFQANGQYAEAARRLNQAMEKNPTYLDAYIQYAFRSSNRTNLEGCAQVLEELTRGTNVTAVIYAYRGLLHNYQEEYAAALPCFEKAEQLAREQETEDDVLTPTFYFWFASACERTGKFEQAVKLFDVILARKPSPDDEANFKAYVDALNYRAYMHAERGLDLDQALAHINEALAARPDSAAFTDTRGWIYFMQGRYEEARVDIARALELLPGDSTITDHMGDVEAKLGRLEDAVAWWKKSFLADPDNQKVAQKLMDQGVDLAPLREEARQQSTATSRQAPANHLPDFGLEDPEPLVPDEVEMDVAPEAP